MQAIDYNMDGRQDILYYDTNVEVWKLLLAVPINGGGWKLSANTIETPLRFATHKDADIVFLDIDSNGTSDAIYREPQQDTIRVRRLSVDETLPESSSTRYRFEDPIAPIGYYGADMIGDGVGVAPDFNGDGQVDLVIAGNDFDCEGSYWSCAAVEDNRQLVVADGFAGGQPGVEILASLPEAAWMPLMQTPDFNGDGLSDAFYPMHFTKSDGKSQYYRVDINNGNGSFTMKQAFLDDSMNKEKALPAVADWNMDGFPDVLWNDHSGSGTIYGRLWNPSTESFDNPIVISTASTGSKKERVLFVDANGDAALDIIIAGYNGNLGDVRVFSRKWGSTYGNVAVNRIETIGNGLGAETSVTYEPISYSDHYERLEIGSTSGTVTQCDYEPGFGETCIPVTVTVPDKDSFYSEINGGWDVPNGAQVIPKSAPVLELGSSMYVVTDVREDAPSAGVAPGSVNNDTSNSISYEYREAKLQAAGRGFLGFKQLTTIDNKSGVRTTTSYRQDWPFTGIPLGTRTETASGHLLANNYSSWEVAEWNASFAETVLNNGSAAVGSIHLFEASALSDAYALENGGSAQGAHLTSASMTMTPDAEGNPSVTTTTSKNQVSGVVELTSVMTTDYDSAFPLWQGRVSRTEAVNTRHGHAPVTRLATFTYRADGLLGSETTYDEDLATVHMRTVHGYDAFGNVVRTATTGDGVTRCDVDTSVYDAGTGRYVDRQYDCLGRLTSVVVDRNKFGQPTAVDAVIDATNTNARVQTRFGYGALGREYFRATEDGSFTTAYLTTDSNNCPSGTAYKSTTTSAGGGQAQACFDVMGRQTRSLTVAMDGRWIATDVEYDALGRSKHESEPYYLGDARYWTTVDYDLLGRTTQMKRPDGALSSIAYNNFDTVETNALSQSRTVKRNGLGETVRTIDDMNGTVDFTYDKYGTLAQTIVNQGQTTTPIVVASYYDYHGNKWKVDDPDKGTWTFKYNAFGELTERKNAICNGSNPSWCQTTVMSYDSVGRLRTRKDFDENQNPNSVTSYEANSEWVYDTAENGLGKLNYVTDSQTGYTQYFDYDQYGRSSIVYTSIDDGSYSEQTTYDQYGRLFQYFDAGGDGSFTDAGVLHVYNSYGYMVATGDAMSVGGAPSTMYKRLVETDARGQPTRVELGVSSDGSAAMTATFGYEPETGLPDWQRVNGYQGALLQHYSYTWDDIGNLKSRTDHRGSAKTDTYIYDQLNRMKRQTTSGQPTQYFDYDINGNLKTRTGVSGTYVYGQYGAGPHAATRVNGTSYWYDANGNNVAGGGRSIDYYTFQKPRSISKGGHATEFDYTPDKVRYRRIDTGSGETITRYIGNVEVISRTTGPNETRRYIDGVAIEISNSASGERETVYVLKDHLGSSDQLVDAFGVPVNTTMSFGAWGQRRNGDSWKELDANQKLIDMGPDFDVHDASIKTTMGYTSHETLDATQVIHMNGRIYDPFIGRFLQADPFVPAPTDSQSHNRYSYVRNNPLSATDPSGFFDMKSFYKKMMQADGRWKTQKYIHNHAQWLDTAVPIALSFIPVWGAAAAAGYSYDSAFYLTGSLNEATRAGAISYVSAEAFSAVGNSNMGFWSKVASNAVIGGVTSELRGGKFGHGFFAAGVATAVPVESMYGNGSYYRPARVITKAVIGGTISEMTGGKFSNGAITAAFAYSLGGIGRQTYAKVSEEDRSYMKMTYATMDATKGDEGFLTRDGFVLDQLIQEESGLKAGLWTGPDGEKVLAYSGANGADFKDWWTSIKQAHGMETKQYKEAIALAENLGSGVHYTGTSLGGGLASVSAMAVGGRATVFNTAGLHSNTLQGLDPGSASIRHLYSTGDILRVLNALTPAKVYGQSYSLGYAGMHGRNGLCAQLCN
jgi:RHS repeat-associated protein